MPKGCTFPVKPLKRRLFDKISLVVIANETRLYLDNAATTPLGAAAREAMARAMDGVYGNASSPYALGRQARTVVDEARREVAQLIGANADEIVFTSGGTESDNWALLGVALANLDKASRPERGHFIVSGIEHHAVLEAAGTLRELGFDVDIARCNEFGYIAPDEIERLLRPATLLVSVMAVNNETGAIQLYEVIGLLCKTHGVLFHCDAVQAAGKIPLDVSQWDVDLLSLSAHKIGGPKGVGALYIRRGTPMRALQRGGGQERARRGGTENVTGIAGFGAAAREARENFEANTAHLQTLCDRLESGLREIEGARINGPELQRAAHITNVSLAGSRAETLALNLDLKGIAVGTGSACASGAIEPSHVLQAMGLDDETARASLRISLGVQNTTEEIKEFLGVLKSIVGRR